MPPRSAGKVVAPYKQAALVCEVLHHGPQEPRWPRDLNQAVNRRAAEGKRGCVYFGGGRFGSGAAVAKQKCRHI